MQRRLLMPDLTKIATCSYCRTRSVLQLRQRKRRELTCPNCSAPLHEMKSLKVRQKPSRARPAPANYRQSYHRPKRKERRKRSIWSELIHELFDEIEDIFD